MIYDYTFDVSCSDCFGYVSPMYMMKAVTEGSAMCNYADGVGFAHIFDSLGVTWMLGQFVMEYRDFALPRDFVQLEIGGHEHIGPTMLRRCVMRRDGKEIMRYTSKNLPVHISARKVAAPSVLADRWTTPATPAGENIPFIQLPEFMQTREVFRVHRRECDINQHMTAFKYLDLALETVDYWAQQPRLLKRVQIDYLRECRYGEVLELKYGFRDGVYFCSGVKEDGSVSFNASVVLSEDSYPYADFRA